MTVPVPPIEGIELGTTVLPVTNDDICATAVALACEISNAAFGCNDNCIVCVSNVRCVLICDSGK